MSFATKYAFPEGDADGAGHAAFVAKAKVTYIDEDGDQINMTSDAELADAFHQVLKKWPVHKPFRITVTVPNDKPSKVSACVYCGGSPMRRSGTICGLFDSFGGSERVKHGNRSESHDGAIASRVWIRWAGIWFPGLFEVRK